MLKQFNLKTLVFDDPVLLVDELGEPILTESPLEVVGQLQYTTSGKDWVAVHTQEEINAISASITGGGSVWLENDKLKTSGRAPSPYHEWSGKGWEINPQQKQAVFSAEKAAKLAEINRKAQDFINEIAHINDTPDFERETWSIQRQEAMAWIADNTASTPTLALIAQIRGVPLDTLRQKAYEKSVAYQTVAAMVAGQRQALEDRLMQAETVEDVRGIEVEYQFLGGENG